MDVNELRGVVLRIVLSEVARQGERFVPVTSSNRHVHLCQADVERLFGDGYRLTKLRDLAQPGQYACHETVTMECPKGKTTLRVVGPVRKETQVELSYTDCFKLGVKPVLRMSGETEGSPGCVLSNESRRVVLTRGVIVAQRHLHMSPAEASAYGLQDGDAVSLVVEGARAAIIRHLVVRSGEAHSLEAHIDKDEANACGLSDGQLCRIIPDSDASLATKPKDSVPASAMAKPVAAVGTGNAVLHTYMPTTSRTVRKNPSSAAMEVAMKAPEAKTTILDLSGEPRRFIAEEDVLLAEKLKHRLIRYASDAIITPLARDAASAKGIELIERV